MKIRLLNLSYRRRGRVLQYNQNAIKGDTGLNLIWLVSFMRGFCLSLSMWEEWFSFPFSSDYLQSLSNQEKVGMIVSSCIHSITLSSTLIHSLDIIIESSSSRVAIIINVICRKDSQRRKLFLFSQVIRSRVDLSRMKSWPLWWWCRFAHTYIAISTSASTISSRKNRKKWN